MAKFVLDGNRMQDRESMHDVLQEVFSLPSYYGRNLDALFDVLSESNQAREIEFRNPEKMPPLLFTTLLPVLLDVGRENPASTLSLSSDELVPGRYRHFKGREYTLLYLALHSETLEPMVVYQAEYGSRGIWVRPAAMWCERMERDGKSIIRFSRMEGK